MRRRIATEYCVHTGHPSWHQQRAGHGSSGAMCFWTKPEAEKYQRSFKKHHPDEPSFIQTTRRVRALSSGR
jgi:hypothetical protein